MAVYFAVKTRINKTRSFVMAQLTTEQRVFLVERYAETGNANEVRRLFQAAFPGRNVPSRSTLYRNIQKYNANGTSLNLNKSNSGRPNTVTTAENVEEVREFLLNNPHASARRNALPFTKSSFNRITKRMLRFHPYRMHIRHELKQEDFERRINFCNWFAESCRDANFLSNFIISDEAGFAMNGEVNSQNVRQYAPWGNNPGFHFNRNESREKLTVWAGLCGNGLVVGPFFIAGNLNGLGYHDLIVENVYPILRENFDADYENGHFHRIWWAQDGAPPHRANVVRDLLREMFPNHIISSHFGDTDWPARSPDLTPCDFFLWGYMKGKVYSSPPPTIEVLQQRIIDEFNRLKDDPAMVMRAVRDMIRRADVCVHREGGHVEGNI